MFESGLASPPPSTYAMSSSFLGLFPSFVSTLLILQLGATISLCFPASHTYKQVGNLLIHSQTSLRLYGDINSHFLQSLVICPTWWHFYYISRFSRFDYDYAPKKVLEEVRQGLQKIHLEVSPIASIGIVIDAELQDSKMLFKTYRARFESGLASPSS
ncbi:hypothetical protein Tco_0758768 [Tanacetum coccineum]